MAAACLKNEDQLPLRLMFQDEARFGRMSDPRSCWAPAPHRPVVNLAMVREFRYEYAAVSPWDGGLDFMTAEKMNTGNMSRFLDQVSKAHPDQFIVMVVDGASSHRSKELEIPKNVSFIRLPPYSPELNPAEQIWNTYSDATTSPIASLMPWMLLQFKPNSAWQRWRQIS